MPCESSVYIAQDMVEPEAMQRLGGSVVVVSTRCPGKLTENEDAAAVIQVEQDSAGALVIADGMGGAAGGHKASRIAIETIHQELVGASGEAESLRAAILNGLETANAGILSLGIGAATTLSAVEIQGRTIRPYHVGDSSILVVGQRGKVKLQTVAHSPVGLAVEAGMLSDEEAMHHEERHLVTNILGSTSMRIEIGPPIQLARFDTLVLATDGVFDNLSVEEVVAHLRKGPLLPAVQQLMTAVGQRMSDEASPAPGKPDDATLIAYRPAAQLA